MNECIAPGSFILILERTGGSHNEWYFWHDFVISTDIKKMAGKEGGANWESIIDIYICTSHHK